MEPEETRRPNSKKKDQELIGPDNEINNSVRHWLALYRSRVYERYYPVERPSKEQSKGSH